MNDADANLIVELLHPFSLAVRIKWTGDPEPSEWDWPLFSPVPDCIETGRLGPVSNRDIEWIELEAVETERHGRLIAEQQVDRSQEVSTLLGTHSLRFLQDGSVFRIFSI